mmetsp:Transcript_9206/g.17398  ORF Transcript_9206/g.17398 Transcript_9206/m.17398 type:complete len:84 (+) Transcript_9206:5389-5640(+)
MPHPMAMIMHVIQANNRLDDPHHKASILLSHCFQQLGIINARRTSIPAEAMGAPNSLQSDEDIRQTITLSLLLAEVKRQLSIH